MLLCVCVRLSTIGTFVAKCVLGEEFIVALGKGKMFQSIAGLRVKVFSAIKHGGF